MAKKSDRRREARRRRRKRGLAPAKRKVAVDFPEALLQRTEEAASALAIDRSKLIRSAVEQYLEMVSRQKLERELAAGYAANATTDRATCNEFTYVDTENL